MIRGYYEFELKVSPELQVEAVALPKCRESEERTAVEAA